MTDDRPTTTDAIKYLEGVVHSAPLGHEFAHTLSLALAEFRASQALVTELEAERDRLYSVLADIRHTLLGKSGDPLHDKWLAPTVGSAEEIPGLAQDRQAERDALEAALRDVCAAADGVQAGVAHLGGYVDNSVVAEVCAFFNGYAGGPDLDAAVAAALALLGDA